MGGVRLTATLTGAALLAVHLTSPAKGFNVFSSEGLPEWAYIENEVPEVQFDELDDLMERREPGIVRGGPTSKWPALEKWKDIEYLKSHIEHIKTVVSDSQTNIYLAPLRALHQVDYEDHQRRQYEKSIHHKQVLNLTVAQLANGLAKQQGTASAPYHYGTSDLTPFLETLGEDITPRDILWRNDTHVHGHAPPKFHLWIGKHGTISGLHYDVFHNYHVQVTGRKRFLIIPTEQWDSVGLFPYLHPHSRHSQYEVEELRKTYGKLDATHGMYVADLSPGDLLYLPPHYFHRVLPLKTDNDELSISVNSWTLSTEALFADYIRNIRIPDVFQESKDPVERAMAYRIFAIELIVRLKAVMATEAVEFMYKLFIERYHGPVAKALNCDDDNWSIRMCPDEDAIVPEKLLNDVGRSVELVRSAFKSARHTSMIRNEVLDMLLADYLEVLAEYVFEYPQACIQMRCLAFVDHASCAAEY